MRVITVLGIDLAKNSFELCGGNQKGEIILRKRVSRAHLLRFISELKPCRIGMEACGGAHHWAREFRGMGHDVRLISPQFVKPFVKSNKNDRNDAEAIWEAVSRPNMRFVPIKELAQQDIQSLHRIRQSVVESRTVVINESRGLLAEYGVVLPQGSNKIRSLLPAILDEQTNKLTPRIRELLKKQLERLKFLEDELKFFDSQIDKMFRENEICQRISKIEGVGPLTATAVFSTLTDSSLFNNGRGYAASLGLVPRQNSTGGKTKLLGISKRGDSYLRSLLIHGGRSALLVAHRKTDRKSLWMASKLKSLGLNKAAVAVANKNARTIWALIATGQEYKKIA